MLGSSARLLRVLSLFQTQRSWAGAELAARLEVTTRTLRRDVEKLRDLGYPIHSSTGVEGGYQMGAGAHLPPLLFDDDEAVAVALALGFAARQGVSGMEDASLRALVKMDQLMPPRLSRRAAALRATVVTVTSAAAQATRVSSQTLSAFANACRDHLVTRFRYRDAGGAVSDRTTEPHRLVHFGRWWYLVAWDRSRGDWRTFRLDRVDGRPRTADTFAGREPPAADIGEYVSRGAAHAGRFRARIVVDLPAAELARTVPPAAGLIEPIDESRCWFDTGASNWETLAMYLAMLGADFRVPAEHAELRAAVAALGARFRRAAK